VLDVTAMTVDPSNVEQAKAWDGDEGAYWADHADRFDRSVAAYHSPFMAAAAIEASEVVLDVGCGTGQTTRDAARTAVHGSALGVDLSARMIDYARRAAARDGLSNVAFERADAQVHPFDSGRFDVAISRTGVTFFGDPVAGLINVARALRPDGRLVLLTWQGPGPNEWIRELSGALAAGRDLPLPPPAAPGPFALSDPDRVRDVLTAAGFADVESEPHNGSMWFGDDADNAYGFVLGLMGWMLQGLDDEGRTRALDNLRRTLSAHDTGYGVLYDSATWITRARRP
jgi:SAM-dependent methyltransferase